MKARQWLIGSFALILAGCAQTQEPYTGPERHVFLGSGGVTGVYYPAAGAICRFVNERRNEHGIRCSAESTGGSIYNINSIRAGELDMGVAESDWQFHAYYGTDRQSFMDAGPFNELRAVFSIHPEPMTIVARADSGIRHLDDLKGHRVNIGTPGSGTRGIWEVVEEAMGWKRSDLSLASALKTAETPQALCDDKIDVFFTIISNPGGVNKKATTICDAVLVEASGPVIDRLVADNPYYRYATIPGGMYRGNPKDVKTFGVGATFVSSTATAPDVVYWVVKSVFEDFNAFKKMHPAFANLKKKEMIKDTLTAPLHEGAIRYYEEAGLM